MSGVHSMPERTSVTIEEHYCILRGMIAKGIAIYGPFDTVQDAIDYGGTNFPDDTREIVVMRKEIVIHG